MRPSLRSLWRGYLAAERDGYRPRTLAALGHCLDAVLSVDERDELATQAFRAHEEGRVPLREPLRVRVLRPYVRDHLAEPQVLWWALQTRLADYELLESYGRYDRLWGNPTAGAITYAVEVTGEPRWWRRLLDHRLDDVEYGTHHLDEGLGVIDGDVIRYVLQVCAAIRIIAQAPAGVFENEHRVEVAHAWSLLRDWLRYIDAEKPGGDFAEWCREQGSEHWVARSHTSTHYYYQPTHTSHDQLAQEHGSPHIPA